MSRNECWIGFVKLDETPNNASNNIINSNKLMIYLMTHFKLNILYISKAGFDDDINNGFWT
jgi:hypothetical protein